MAGLVERLKQEMQWYGEKRGLNNRTFFLANDETCTYAVTIGFELNHGYCQIAQQRLDETLPQL